MIKTRMQLLLNLKHKIGSIVYVNGDECVISSTYALEYGGDEELNRIYYVYNLNNPHKEIMVIDTDISLSPEKGNV